MELFGKIPVTIISTELEASNCNSRDMTKNNSMWIMIKMQIFDTSKNIWFIEWNFDWFDKEPLTN